MNKIKHYQVFGFVAGLITVAAAVVSGATSPAAASTTWNVGDVYAGVAAGQYNVYDNSGVFKETITDGLGGFTTGCAFNNDLSKLYTTNFTNTKVVVYDDPSPHPISQTIDPGVINPCGQSESVVFAANGDFYVGHPDGDDDIQRYDAAGVQTYDVAGEDGWFALNLDPNGTSFWAGDFGTNNFYRFGIASGLVEVGPIASGGSLFGLCVKGELTAAIDEIKLDPPTATNETGTDHTVTATVTAGGAPVVGALVSFSVTAGPNIGQVSDPNTGECTANNDCTTDANGQVSWTYTGTGGPGLDVITACFTDEQGVEHCARATKEWTEPVSLPGRMTGGGTIPVSKTTLEGKHGFELHCDPADLPNRLEVNWGKGNKFHLESLTSALCSNDPTLDEEQPVAGFDTYKGEGTGRYNGVSGYTAKWKFTDDGEPGTTDYATISIFDPLNVLVQTFTGNLKNGNHQAHPN